MESCFYKIQNVFPCKSFGTFQDWANFIIHRFQYCSIIWFRPGIQNIFLSLSELFKFNAGDQIDLVDISFWELFLWTKGDDSEAFDGDPNVSKLPTSVTFCSETEMRFLNLGKIIFLCLRSISWNWYIYTTVQYFCLLYILKSSISICSWCPLTSILIYVQCLSKLGHLSQKSKTKCKNKRK